MISINGFTETPRLALLFLLCAALLTVLARIRGYLRFRSRAQGCRLPPGPKPLPLIGNLLDIPKDVPWLGYQSLSKRYGSSIIHLQPMGQSLIILNDYKTAMDLFEKRSAIYSSKPDTPMVDLTGWNFDMGFMPYGQYWRSHRRLFWQHFNPSAIPRYHAALEASAHNFLLRLLRSPQKVQEHIRYSIGGSLIRVTYGLQVSEEKDKYITAYEDGAPGLQALLSGSSIIEYLPWLANVSNALPGTQYLRDLTRWRNGMLTLRNLPWSDAEKARLAGRDNASVAHALMASETNLTDLEIAKDVAAVTYAAGIDTQNATLVAFFVAMSLYPDVQKAAQAELDAIVGPDRLPNPADRRALPYINAIVKETTRWHPVTPMGLAHANTTDDVYEGFFIPKDSVILPNAWAMLHDPEVYPQPEEFRPERFLKDGELDPNVRDPATVVFGFGRRICPGRYFADISLFIYISTVLHVFDIMPPLDGEGNPVRVLPRITTGITSYMETCDCIIKPRSKSTEDLINAGSSAESSYI